MYSWFPKHPGELLCDDEGGASCLTGSTALVTGVQASKRLKILFDLRGKDQSQITLGFPLPNLLAEQLYRFKVYYYLVNSLSPIHAFGVVIQIFSNIRNIIKYKKLLSSRKHLHKCDFLSLLNFYLYQSGFSRKTEPIYAYTFVYVYILIYINMYIHMHIHIRIHMHHLYINTNRYKSIYFQELVHVTVEVGMFEIHRAGGQAEIH